LLVVSPVGSVGLAVSFPAEMAMQITIISMITKTAIKPSRISRVSVCFFRGRLRLCSMAIHQSFYNARHKYIIIFFLRKVEEKKFLKGKHLRTSWPGGAMKARSTGIVVNYNA